MIIDEYIRYAQARAAHGPFAARDLEAIEADTTALAQAAFAGERHAAEQLHRSVYQLLVHSHRPPCSTMVDLAFPPVATFLWSVANEWDCADRVRFRDALAAIPGPGDYPEWIGGLLGEHPSGAGHPLFDFLATRADYDQLREHFWQETPLDLHFADLIIALAPAFSGRPKAEIATNFWDEMGEGDARKAHRTLRVRMMERLGLDEPGHGRGVEELLLEELELANAYFLAGTVRSYANQLIGMLLATESMAPGRLQRQVSGWRRVGLADEDLEYLLVHTVIDVAHGQHWMDEVVRPIIAETPGAMVDVTLGALRRLDVAERICDRMLVHLRSDDVEAGGDAAARPAGATASVTAMAD